MTTTALQEAAPSEAAQPSETTTTDQLGREALRLGKRWRRQAMPLVGIGGTHGIGAISAALAGPAALVPVAAGWASAAGAYSFARSRASRWERLHAGVAAMSSALGQVAVALDGTTGASAAVVWAAGCALAVPWWVRHTELDPDVTAELAAYEAQVHTSPLLEGTPDPRVVLWDEYIAAKAKALPGSTLSSIRGFAYGWQAVIELPVGQHWHDIMSARKAILSVYDLPDGRVFVESVPGKSVRRARITVLTTDPLQTVTRWSKPGLDPATGTAPLMTTADGELLHWRFWWPIGGSTHGLVSGVNGSGKTKVLDLILTEAKASDRIVPFVVDGGEGASLPQWRDQVAQFAETPADARKLLTYLLRLMDRRREVLKRRARKHGVTSLEPAPEMPLLLCVIDEAHRLLMSEDDVDNSDIRRMCERLTQEGRKFGIALVLATQVPSATQLGGSTVLRDQLKGGTVVGLRVTERTSGNMITSGTPMPEGLHELPAEFPDGTPTRGLGYVLTSRMICARSLLIAGPDQQPEGLFLDTPLDTDCASEAAPAFGKDEQPTLVFQTNESNADDAVLHALAGGCAKNPIALMEATGLSMGEVRRSLGRV